MQEVLHNEFISRKANHFLSVIGLYSALKNNLRVEKFFEWRNYSSNLKSYIRSASFNVNGKKIKISTSQTWQTLHIVGFFDAIPINSLFFIDKDSAIFTRKDCVSCTCFTATYENGGISFAFTSGNDLRVTIVSENQFSIDTVKI